MNVSDETPHPLSSGWVQSHEFASTTLYTYFMSSSFDGQSVLVFGASRGIGAAVAREFATRGHAVAGTHRGSSVPEGVLPIQADIRSVEDITQAFQLAAEAHGPVGIVVIASGITRDSLLMRMSEEDLREVMETNAIGPMLVAKSALRPMLKARSGSIVFLSSASVKYGVAGQTNYTASKGAIEAFARSMSREYSRYGIRVNVVAPGPTETDMIAAMPEHERQTLISQTPMNRLGTAEEVAEVVYNVSLSTFMTGAVVLAAGGL